MEGAGVKDFFISYTGSDGAWAEWIGWQLEEVGLTVILQAWDFGPGSNFVLEMQGAASASERTILVLSESALTSGYVQAEWAARFREDPTGEGRRLLPVRIEACDIVGLLGPITYIDLVGLESEAAKATLIAGVSRERQKPSTEPMFPGGVKHAGAQPEFPSSPDGLPGIVAHAPPESFPSVIGSPAQAFTPTRALESLDRPVLLRPPILTLRVGAAWASPRPREGDAAWPPIADSPARKALRAALLAAPSEKSLMRLAGILGIDNLSPWVETDLNHSGVISFVWIGWSRPAAPALDAQCIFELPSGGPAGPYVRTLIDVVVSPVGEEKSEGDWLAPGPLGLPQFRLDIPRLYGLLAALVETVVSIRPVTIVSELRDAQLDVVGAHLVADGADIQGLIDISMLKQTARPVFRTPRLLSQLPRPSLAA